MTILSRGTKQTYYGNCEECNTIFSAQSNEVNIANYLDNGKYIKQVITDCPVCDHSVTMQREPIVDDAYVGPPLSDEVLQQMAKAIQEALLGLKEQDNI